MHGPAILAPTKYVIQCRKASFVRHSDSLCVAVKGVPKPQRRACPQIGMNARRQLNTVHVAIWVGLPSAIKIDATKYFTLMKVYSLSSLWQAF